MAWLQVQTLDGGQVAGSAASLTASAWSIGNVTVGNRIVLFTGAYFSGARTLSTNTPTSTPSLTWTKLAEVFTNDNSVGRCHTIIWTAVVGATGTLSITVTNPAGNVGDELGWTAAEFSGLNGSAGSGCLDVSATGVGSSGAAASTTCPTGTTGTVAGAGELAIASVSDWGASLTYAAPSGFNLQAALSRAGATMGQGVATRTTLASETEGGNFTYTSTAVNNGALVVVIKLAAAATVADSIQRQTPFRRGRWAHRLTNATVLVNPPANTPDQPPVRQYPFRPGGFYQLQKRLAPVVGIPFDPAIPDQPPLPQYVFRRGGFYQPQRPWLFPAPFDAAIPDRPVLTPYVFRPGGYYQPQRPWTFPPPFDPALPDQQPLRSQVFRPGGYWQVQQPSFSTPPAAASGNTPTLLLLGVGG